MSKNPVISIVGQTATGKTSLALELAEKVLSSSFKKVVLLSADSKQVFQGLEILTGADLPQNFKAVKKKSHNYRFFTNEDQSIELHGVSIIAGDEEWSVAHFSKLFRNIYKQIEEKSLLIVVGGTGLYHQQLFTPAATAQIPPNEALRKELEKLTLKELQKKLAAINQTRWQAMNHSDQHNPRRLIRAIEITQTAHRTKKQSAIAPLAQLGLQLPSEDIEKQIAKRVEQRIKSGVFEEISGFEAKYSARELQAKAAIGYQAILDYLNKKLPLEQLKQAWTLEETQYAKRQQTWWKKQPAIEWFQANHPQLLKQVQQYLESKID